MNEGFAPIGNDGKKINLHHMTQRQDGAIAELTQIFHQKHSSTIDINSGTEIPSGINRSKFNNWKKQYWKERARIFK